MEAMLEDLRDKRRRSSRHSRCGLGSMVSEMPARHSQRSSFGESSVEVVGWDPSKMIRTKNDEKNVRWVGFGSWLKITMLENLAVCQYRFDLLFVFCLVQRILAEGKKTVTPMLSKHLQPLSRALQILLQKFSATEMCDDRVTTLLCMIYWPQYTPAIAIRFAGGNRSVGLWWNQGKGGVQDISSDFSDGRLWLMFSVHLLLHCFIFDSRDGSATLLKVLE